MLSAGQSLRHYRVERLLGSGGMGEVYLASDTKLQRKVALKVLSTEGPVDHKRKKRFVREAIAASRLNHPNISVVYDADETPEGIAFITMEYIEGETLASRLRQGPLPLKLVCSYGLQIADALDEAHRNTIIHRDLKPANVMIDRQGRVKILDFGLARFLDIESEPIHSAAVTLSREDGTIAGTPLYMSPEQVRGEQLDPRTDIFSFGVLLHELITGQNPFEAPSAPMAFSRILKEEPEPIRKIRPEVPPDLERMISKALEKDRERRYRSAGEIAVDLRRLEGSGTAPPIRHAMNLPRQTAVAAAAATALAIASLVYFGASGSAPSHDAVDSLAVLPLQSLSSRPEGDYLADGMTEALISGLAQIRALKVISRTSVMQYKGTEKTMPQIGRELGVDAVIEGSVAQDAGRIRVTAQLIDARTDRHLWAKSYDRELQNVLQLQDEIARAVAEEVRAQLLPGEEMRFARARPINPQAHELYVRARYEWNRRGPESLRQSADLLQRVVAMEPEWPLAYAALADSYNILANNGFIPNKEGLSQGRAAARRALELDPDLAQAHAALAFTLWQYDRDWDAAEREFRKAIELQPSYASAHHFYALYLAARERDSEALAEIRKALELDPFSPRINTNYGDILRSIGRETEAIAQLEKWRILDSGQALRSLVFAYVHQRNPAEAVRVADEAAAKSHSGSKMLQALALAASRPDVALPIIRELDRESAGTSNGGRLLTLSAAYVVAGHRERGWELLEKCLELTPTQFPLREPLLEPLRSDPRYPALLKKLGLR